MQSLGRRRHALATREQALLESLIEFLTGFGAPAGDVELLRRTLADMAEPFMLVVVGEFNAGKSALINALVGSEVAAVGSLPTTKHVTILKHSPEASLKEKPGGVIEKGIASEFLRPISIVDTPGTNAVIRLHEKLSREFVPRSDLVLFVTSAERPLTESEREYLGLIRDWGKKIVLIISKVDVLEEAEIETVRLFVQDQVRLLLGLTPPVFPVSGRLVRRAREEDDVPDEEREELLRRSGFEDLEAYVVDLMSDRDLSRLKLQSPLGVAEELIRRYRKASEDRAAVLEEDSKLVGNLESLLDAYRDDARREFGVRLEQIEAAFDEIDARADAWFDANSGLGVSVFGRKEGLQEDFRGGVVSGAAEKVDGRVRDLINWLVFRHVKQWRQVADYVDLHRRADLTRRIAGDVTDGFGGRREALLRSVDEGARSTVEAHDYGGEAHRLASTLRGAATDAPASPDAASVTGTDLALLEVGSDLAARPGRKSRDEFRRRTAGMRERLNAAVRDQLDREIETSVGRMRLIIAPFGTFVKSELSRMRMAESILEKIGAGAHAFRLTTDTARNLDEQA